MAKATKATVAARTGDVQRLLLAGAEFDDIWRYSLQQGWQVSERQVRRYIQSAYQQMASLAWRNQRQLLGRHLMQRRALYARAMKAGDNRTALRVLQDEASLEGLYPSNKASSSALDGEPPYAGAEGPALSRRQRVVRLLVAQGKSDSDERRLIEQVTPMRKYWLPDTMLPIQMLNLMAMIHIAEQLDLAALFVNAVNCDADTQDADDDPQLLMITTAHRFRLGHEAWQRFCRELGVDGDELIDGNSQSIFLELYTDELCKLAPTPRQLRSATAKLGVAKKDLVSIDQLVRRWWRPLDRVCPD